MIDLLGSDERRLARPTVEWLYHSFRCRAWDSKGNSIASHTDLPRCPTSNARSPSMRARCAYQWKNHGAYEAELIRRADRRLAQYPSIYGHDFAGPPPLSMQVRGCATSVRPPWLRRYTYRLKHVRPPPGDWPGYLATLSGCGAARRGPGLDSVVSARPDQWRGAIRANFVAGICTALLWYAC